MTRVLRAEDAPAKVNLALHVVGRRGDGYHLLDSLVVFPEVGDAVEVAPADTLTLSVEGPFAASLGASNLILDAARLLAPERGAALRLVKRLPVAAGIGGGSADAAAAVRLLARHWELPLPSEAALLALGADVPVCLIGRACRMQGIGEQVTPLAVPGFWIVLANPGVPVETRAVFEALDCRDNPPMATPPAARDAAALFSWLRGQRNDLEAPAAAVAPAIAIVLAALRAQTGCALARMSGSGATCFGLFETEAAAADAAGVLARQPGWWVAAAPVGATHDGSRLAAQETQGSMSLI